MLLFALFPSFAESSLCLELVHELDSPCVFPCEVPLVSLVNDLDLVGRLVSAHFIHLEQVNHLGFIAYMKVPYTVQLTSNTMHRLVCLDVGSI